MAFLLITCGALAAAGGDSLVSLSYLTGTFQPKALEEGQKAADSALQETYDEAKKKLDDYQKTLSPGSTGSAGQTQKADAWSDVLAPQSWKQGELARLGTGSGFLLASGSVTLQHDGAVVDITEGAEAASGTALKANHRYLVAENTTATLYVQAASSLAVQGGYSRGTWTPGSPFTDVLPGTWYTDAVAYVYEKNLFTGTDGTHFDPNGRMDRSMMITVLYRLAGNPTVSGRTPVYTDVAKGAWYEKAVSWGGSMGITTGTGDGTTFSPSMALTREQAVSFLYRYATRFLGESKVSADSLSGYRDRGKVSDWAVEGLAWAVKRGIITSTSSTESILDPQGVATRAQMAVLLQNFSQKLG